MPPQPRKFRVVGWFHQGKYVGQPRKAKYATLWDFYINLPPQVSHVVLQPKHGTLWLVDFSKNMRHPQNEEMYVSDYHAFPNLDAVKAAHFMMEMN